jgi:ABC-type methionine transport system ATPase subunit
MAKYHRLKMGMVFQSFNLIKSLNVWENVALPQTADGVPIGRRFKRAKRLLRLFNVDEYWNRHPNEISGGEQQRVAIARSLINNPLLMLVDEPTGNLDSKAADDVMQLLHGLHMHSKHTIILVTHNPDYLHFASRVIHIQDGEIKKQEYNTVDPDLVPKALPAEHFEELKGFKTAADDETSTVNFKDMGDDASVIQFTEPTHLAHELKDLSASSQATPPPTPAVSKNPPPLFGDKQ